MEPMANESQPIPAYDDPEPRLTKLEEAVVALQCDNALLRQRVDTGFETAQAQLAVTEEKLRREFHDGLHDLERILSAKIEGEARRLEGRISGELIARLDRQDARMDRLDAKIDQLAKWMIATQLTTMALIVGIAIQLFLR
jgi:hypothetical protein